MNMNNSYIKPAEKLLVIIGPSGAGKSAIINELQKDKIIEVTPSWTTRKRRQGEENSPNHVFTTLQKFSDMKSAGLFIETVQLFGSQHFYGLPKVTRSNTSVVPTVLLRSTLIPLLRKHYSSAIIYQVEADKEISRQRMINRNDNASDIESRLKEYDKEILQGRKVAKRIFKNLDNFDKTYAQIAQAISKDFHLG